MGYCLSNSVEAHKMWFFLGGGSNGKSVLCDVLTDLVGGIENISTVSLSRFGSPFALAHIKDKTMNIATENEVNRTLNTQTIKAISSGDPIQIEEKFKTPLSYRPRTKLIFSLNNMPRIKDLSEGLGRRLDIVPFKIRFVRNPKFPNERKLIPNIKRRFQKERKGIFAFAIEGLKRLQKNKYAFSDCPVVEEQREKIGRPGNLCDGFAMMCLEVDDADDWEYKKKKGGEKILISKHKTRTKTGELFASFIGWCLKNEHEKEAKSMSMKIFLKDFRATLQNRYDFLPVKKAMSTT
jgi:putative DNA primase/helicase